VIFTSNIIDVDSFTFNRSLLSALEVTDEIDKCENLEYLDLDGNTIGIAAAERIGESLRRHAEFKRALWKNMFTGRTKQEIPPALVTLRFLSSFR